LRARAQIRSGRTAVPQDTETVPLTKLAGKTLCIELYAENPLGIDYQGLDVYATDGYQTRPLT
jgi:hypothetical protein